jgi:hypothetical protein
MITNRKENKCPLCKGELIELEEISSEFDDTGLIRRTVCECADCHIIVTCKENYALCDIQQLSMEEMGE